MPRAKATRYCTPPATIDLRHVRTGKRLYWCAMVGYAQKYDVCQTEAIRRLLEHLSCDTSLAVNYENHPTHPTLVRLVKPEGYVEPKDLVPVFVTEEEGG